MRISALCSMALCLTALAGGASGGLISNGNFESGDGGFLTDYVYTPDLTASGTVVVGCDPCDHHPLAASYGDHTSGRGRMLIANGSVDGGAAVWEQTVSVVPNTEYAFYYWLSAWTPATFMPPQIRCLINGVRAGPAGFASAKTGEWGLTLFRWNSGDNSQANIRLVDRSGTIENNDFALDDIGMIEAEGKYVLITASTLGGSVDFPGEGAFLYPPGEVVVLEAKCEPGYEFVGWTGEFSDDSPRIWADMNGDRVATAVFRKLDHQVTIRASGLAMNEFSACDDSAERLDILCRAMESGEPNGLILGERKGLCEATYLFPVFMPPTGIQGLAKIVVNVYGATISSGSAVWIAGTGPHWPVAGGTHTSFGPGKIANILEDTEEPVYWLPVRIAATMGNWDLAAVYVSYECPGIPGSLLRRFHDYFSVCQALDHYAQSQSVRDLFALRKSGEPVWEVVAQTTALAEDLADGSDPPNAGGNGVGSLRDLGRWQALAGARNLVALAGCNTEAIVACLDNAAAGGRSCVLAYADAIGDGDISREEALEINQKVADWRADLIVLDTAMDEAVASLGDVVRRATALQDERLRLAAEMMIRSMAPWHTGKLDDAGCWTSSSPTYLDHVIQALRDVEPDRVRTAPAPNQLTANNP